LTGLAFRYFPTLVLTFPAFSLGFRPMQNSVMCDALSRITSLGRRRIFSAFELSARPHRCGISATVWQPTNATAPWRSPNRVTGGAPCRRVSLSSRRGSISTDTRHPQALVTAMLRTNIGSEVLTSQTARLREAATRSIVEPEKSCLQYCISIAVEYTGWAREIDLC
jgi:hypothetical protein